MPDAEPAGRAGQRLRTRAPLLRLAPEGAGQALDAVRAGHRHHRPHLHARVLRRRAQARPLHRGRQHAGARSARPRSKAAVRALRAPGTKPKSVYQATSGKVYNEVFTWGPRNVRRGGPDVMRNVVARNRKVPLTGIEQAIGLAPGPNSGAAARRNLAALPGARHQGQAGLRHQPARLPLRQPAGRHRPVLERDRVLHALPGPAGRQRGGPGRRQPGRLDRPRRRRHPEVAAAVVDDVHVARGGRPVGALRLQRHAHAHRQRRRPDLRRPDRHHPARPGARARAATTSATAPGSRARTGPT